MMKKIITICIIVAMLALMILKIMALANIAMM